MYVFFGTLRTTPLVRSAATQTVRHQRCVFSCEFDLTIVAAAAHEAEMLHSFPSIENSGGRRRRSAHPDRTGCLHPPLKRRLELETSLALSSNTPDSLPAIIPAWQEENLG